MSKIIGKFVLESSDNFDDFMKALGVGMVTRKLATATTPTVEITENEGTYSLKTTSTVKNFDITFKLGVEFDESTTDGRDCKTTITKEGDNKLIQVQKNPKGKDATYIREFTDAQMIMDCECNGVKCKRVYKRV